MDLGGWSVLNRGLLDYYPTKQPQDCEPQLTALGAALANASELPIEAIFVAPFLRLLGGGAIVATTNLFAILADTTPDEAQRTKQFGYFQSVSQVTQLLSPVLGSITMTENLFLPFLIAISMFFLSSLILAVFPDTRNVVDEQTDLSTDESGEREPLLRRGDGQHPSTSHVSFRRHMVQAFRRTQGELHDAGMLFVSSKNVSLCLAVFLVISLAGSAYGTLIQYISLRYSWKVAEAGYIYTIKAGCSIILYTLIVPLGLNFLVKKRGHTKLLANVWAAKASLVAHCVGMLGIAVSLNIWILIPCKISAMSIKLLSCINRFTPTALILYTLGSSLGLFMLSLLTSAAYDAIDTVHTARIYSASGLVEAIGSLVGVPLITALWTVSINAGGLALGFPFLVSS
ncbi:hypothetical protein GP486_008414, partial [Trichoglossum hirsutum]